MDKSRIPIIVGSSRFTPSDRGATGMTVIELMAKTSGEAAEDAGLSPSALKEAETVAVVSGGPPNDMTMDLYPNQPKTLADALGIPAKIHHQRCRGGDGAVGTTTIMAQRIAEGANGTAGLILLAASMNAATVAKIVKEASGQKLTSGGLGYDKAGEFDTLQCLKDKLGWDPATGTSPEMSGTIEVFNNEQERDHGLLAPVDSYPLYESRLRYRYKRGVQEHLDRVGELMSGYSKIAASDFNKDYSWYPTERTAEDIKTPTKDNRWVGWPYTKAMNAMPTVDHSASWLMCSVATAERLGIAPGKWIYVHGGAYANQGDSEKGRLSWFVSHWTDYSRIPSMEASLLGGLSSAGVSAKQIQHFDFYACFPSVVQMAADIMELPHDAKNLTVTGGLPYYGQNGTLSSLVAMLDKLRQSENKGHFGLVSGNGGLGQKHSVGIFSTTPPTKPFIPASVADTQGKVDAIPLPAFAEKPQGPAEIVTYQVKHTGAGPPNLGLLIGRLTKTGEQFIANTPAGDVELLEAMKKEEWIGKTGTVAQSADGKINVFAPDGWTPPSKI